MTAGSELRSLVGPREVPRSKVHLQQMVDNGFKLLGQVALFRCEMGPCCQRVANSTAEDGRYGNTQETQAPTGGGRSSPPLMDCFGYMHVAYASDGCDNVLLDARHLV